MARTEVATEREDPYSVDREFRAGTRESHLQTTSRVASTGTVSTRRDSLNASDIHANEKNLLIRNIINAVSLVP